MGCNRCHSHNCSDSCHVKCPTCGFRGYEVPLITVAHLTSEVVSTDLQYYLCTNPNCQVAYFDSDAKIITKDRVKVPIWFKSSYEEYLVCYCRKIYLKDVVEVVFALGGKADKESIFKYLKKDEIKTNCIVNNPAGEDCDKLMTNAIEYAKNLWSQKQTE